MLNKKTPVLAPGFKEVKELSKNIIQQKDSSVNVHCLTVKEVIDQIKEDVNIINLAQEMGYELNGNKILCPFHSEKTASCHLYESDNSFFCFGCRKRGSVIDLYLQKKNLSFLDASKDLARKLGILWPKESEEKRQDLEKELSRQLKMAGGVKKWAFNLKKEEKKYLRNRGFTDQFIKENSWGFCSDKMPKKPNLAEDLGLLIKKNRYIPAERLVIPFFQYGKLVQIAFHKPGGKPKYLYPGGWKKPLVGNLKPGEQPILVEGVFCYFSLIQAGIPAITGLGIHLSKEQKSQLKKVGDFYICFDNEPEAQKTARKLAEEFFPSAKIIDLSEGKDVNDLLQELEREKFKKYFLEKTSTAQDYLQLVFKEIQGNPKDEGKRKEAIKLIALLDDVEQDIKIAELHKILKPLSIKKSTLQKTIQEAAKENPSGKVANGYNNEKTQQDILIELAEDAELFKNEHREAFARFPVDNHFQIWPVKSKDFKFWLTKKYYDETGKGPNSEALSTALNTISAKAWQSDKRHKLHVRVAWHEGNIYYDLADNKWRAVKISPAGWEIVEKPPILFRRYAHMEAQPEPDKSGNIKELLSFVNITGEEAQILYLCSIIADCIPDIPHIIKVFFGPGGSGKSSTSKIGRQVVDPSSAPTCRSYRDKKEFVQYLAHNHCIILDNLSWTSPDLSDLICSAVTGDGDSKRALYTDDDDIIYVFKRCFTINGINNVALRPDLLRRSILFGLEKPDLSEVKEEQELWKEFKKAQPRILGGILNILAKAMEIRPDIKLDGLYDMADFTRWGAAIAEALGYTAEKFLRAYGKNKAEQTEEAISNNPVAVAVKSFIYDQEDQYWKGSASELLGELEQVAEKERINIKAKGWPKAANSLSRKLNEVKTTMQEYGVEVTFEKSGNHRTITLEVSKNTVHTVPAVQLLNIKGKSRDNNSKDNITIGQTQQSPSPLSSKENLFDNEVLDDLDDLDDSLSSFLNEDFDIP